METTIAAGKRRALQVKALPRTGFSTAKRKRFLDALAASCNVTAAARVPGSV